MAKDFKGLLFSISQQLNQQDVKKLVGCTKLPEELRDQSPAFVLDRLVEKGKFSAGNLDAILDTMKDIGRSDLHKEVKLFKKKRKKQSVESFDTPIKFSNFDTAEYEATQVKNTLRKMEGSDVIVGVKRIEEVYSEAVDAAENLVRIIKRANCLSRTLRQHTPAARSVEGSSRSSPPTKSPAASPAEPSPVQSPAGFKSLSKKFSKSSFKAKEKGKEKEPVSPSPSPQDIPSQTLRVLNRSQSERTVTNIRPVLQPTMPPIAPGTHVESDTDSDGYDLIPDFPNKSSETAEWCQAMPQTVPKQKPFPPPTTHLPTPPSSGSPRDTFTLPHNFRGRTLGWAHAPRQTSPAVPIPVPHKTANNSEQDVDEYDDVNNFRLQKNRSMSQTLQNQKSKDAASTMPVSNEGTPTDSNPPPVKTKRKRNGPVSPAIPIRQSSLKGHHPTETSPNQPIVDVQQQLRETLRLKIGSPQSRGNTTSSNNTSNNRVSPHPVSVAKSLEMSNSINSDCNDSTGDSGFIELTPTDNKALLSTTPNLGPTQSYVNIEVANSASDEEDDTPDYINVKKYMCPS